MGARADNSLGWRGGLSHGVGSRGVGKIATASFCARTVLLMMNIKYECVRKHAKRMKLNALALYLAVLCSFPSSLALSSESYLKIGGIILLTRALQIQANALNYFVFFMEEEY